MPLAEIRVGDRVRVRPVGRCRSTDGSSPATRRWTSRCSPVNRFLSTSRPGDTVIGATLNTTGAGGHRLAGLVRHRPGLRRRHGVQGAAVRRHLQRLADKVAGVFAVVIGSHWPFIIWGLFGPAERGAMRWSTRCRC